MEDEGSGRQQSGVSSTHGAWTHVAMTWRSSDGLVQLFTDGRLVATMQRAKVRQDVVYMACDHTAHPQGKRLPSGGTLVLGREQDCVGGCFDSAPGMCQPPDRSKS